MKNMFIHDTLCSYFVGCISITEEWVIWQRFIETLFIPDETKGASALENAIENVVSNANSIHGAAKAYGIQYSTLRDHAQLKKQGGPILDDTLRRRMSTVGVKHKTVFSTQQEFEMNEYIKQAAEIAMGMTGDEARKFAFKCGLYFKIKMPESWIMEEKAGKKWLKLYIKQNNLCHQKPLSTSHNRLLAWNSGSAEAFMQILGELYDRYKFHPTRIFAGEETGVTTVTDSPKIIAPSGSKR